MDRPHWNRFLDGPLLTGERPRLRRAFVRLIDGADDRWLALSASLLLKFARRAAHALGLSDQKTTFLDALADSRVEGEVAQIELLRMIARRFALTAEPAAATRLDERLDLLAEVLTLEPLDRAIIGVFARVSVMTAWSQLLQAAAVGKSLRLAPVTLAKIIDSSQLDLERRYQLGMPIRRNGLIWRNGASYEPGLLLFRIASDLRMKGDSLQQNVALHALPVCGTSYSMEKDLDRCGSGADGLDVV